MGGDGGGAGDSGGREGDWVCGGCRNRNYAFRSLCNRCKQPRLLVDAHTPRDSKWLPRAGDWICAGCSNNNYASRNICKKCGLLKKDAAMPAISMPGVSVPSYAQYFARSQGMPAMKFNYGIESSSAWRQSILPNPGWPYEQQSSASWSFNPSNANQFPNVSKDWRAGDWMCSCGFHNYSSRTQCKECSAPMQPATVQVDASSRLKRLASEELISDWDSKRLNPGNGPSNFFMGLDLPAGHNVQTSAFFSKQTGGDLLTFSSDQANFHSQVSAASGLLGKGAKQWREGDWMCHNCSNHNYASRTFCNRCKSQKEGDLHAGGI